MFVLIKTTGSWTNFFPPRHSPGGWTGGLRRPGTSPARPVWTSRSGPARIQRGGASRYDPVGGSLQKMHAHKQPLFHEPVRVPMVLRDVAGLTEAPPGRMDAGKGSKGLKSLHLGQPWAGLLFSQNAVSPERPPAPTPHSVRPHHHHTRPAALFWPLQVQVDPSTCPRRSEKM